MSKFFEPILSSVEQFPLIPRKILQESSEILSKGSIEEKGQILVGGFLFLRILNPTLTSPYRYIDVHPNGKIFV